jgi:hypothetical protein
MDALRKSIGTEAPAQRAGKKPPQSENDAAAKGIGLIKSPAKTAARRKSA